MRSTSLKFEKFYLSELIKAKRLLFLYFSGVEIPEFYALAFRNFDPFYKGHKSAIVVCGLFGRNNEKIKCVMDENDEFLYVYRQETQAIYFSEKRRELKTRVVKELTLLEPSKHPGEISTTIDAVESALSIRHDITYGYWDTNRRVNALFTALRSLYLIDKYLEDINKL